MISSRLQQQIEEVAAREHPGGEVTYTVCSVCGQARWVSTRNNTPRRVLVELHQASDCTRCQNVYQRNPELVQWILIVMKNRCTE